MKRINKLEELLEKYSIYKYRITFLEREKKVHACESVGNPPKIITRGINYPEYLSKNNLENRTQIISEAEEMIPVANSREDELKENENIENELAQMKYFIEMIDVSLNMVKNFNERYKMILESFYIKKVRMEDIAEMMHTSRSRCYELCKEAIIFMSKIVFGEE